MTSFPLPYMKRTAFIAWVSILVALALATRPESLASWLALTLVAVVPAAVVMHLWRAPVTSTSESIRSAIR